jgi:hypothetical protein
MSVPRSVFAIPFLLATASPAVADWQFTTWGMTIDAVQSSINSAGITADKPDTMKQDTVILIRNYYISDIRFGVALFFPEKSKILGKIVMCVTDDVFGMAGRVQVKTALLRTLGKPESDESGPGFNISVWKDQARNNTVISTLRTGEGAVPSDSCVAYFPLASASTF